MTIKVGWITAEYPGRPSRRSVWLRSGPMVTMRYRNLALWLNRHGFQNEFYQRAHQYDAVVVIKAFTESILEEVKWLKSQGTSVIFDANVNYYTIWGDYQDSNQHPTQDQQRAAKTITRLADHVIADSEYLRDVVRDFNPNVTWIPDNVLTWMFHPGAPHGKSGQLRLIWSGVAAKSNELLLIREALASVSNLELWLVSEKQPIAFDSLAKLLPVRWFRYSDPYYAWLLGRADAIISPRHLNNGYNLGHTEYKITLGMARSLPAVASPQPAYISAISRGGGGLICDSIADWVAALLRLRDDLAFRHAMGQAARRTVETDYATPVVTAQLGDLLRKVIAAKS
jgi:glycosyltransferase involved in cell wall biosynthesis